jgi:hypothetical protein
MPGRKPGNPVCPKCHEPKSGYIYTNPGTYLSKLKTFDSRGINIFKSCDWDSVAIAEDDFDASNRERAKAGEPPQSWQEHITWAIPDLPAPTHRSRWTRRHLGRNLFFSVRLEQLLKRAKVKGQLVRSYCFKEVQPSSEDETWIQEKLRLLNAGSSSDLKHSSRNVRECQQWLKQFLQRNAAKKPTTVDFAAFEKKHKIKMPGTYKDFISAVGSKSFPDVGGLKGSRTTVLAPNKLDFEDYRRDQLARLIGAPTKIDGVLFARVNNGDGFVFDVASPRTGEYSIHWYRHEENELELFASNFAACIKRFADQD